MKALNVLMKKPAWLGKSGYISAKFGKDELLRRITEASEYLSSIDQDVSTKSFDTLAEALIQPSILRHRDKEIRMLVACCLADVMRVYAPDPPYDDDTTKEICSLFVAQLRGLADTEHPNFASYFYLLERLALVKTLIVLIELDADDIAVEAFEAMFSVVTEDHSNSAKTHMIEVMSAYIEESSGASQPMLDSILRNLVEPNKTDNPAAYSLAQQLIKSNGNALGQLITAFLNDVIYSGEGVDSDLRERAHDILREVHRIDPDALIGVLPNMIDELAAEDLTVRHRASKVLLDMFTERGTAMPSEYSPLFQKLVDRFNDTDTDIRLLLTSKAGEILRHHKRNWHTIEALMVQRCKDTDDRVRSAAVDAVCKAALEDPDCVSDELLQSVALRMLDRKPSVRELAHSHLVRLYRARAGDSGGAARYTWIPQCLLKFYKSHQHDRVNRIKALITFTADIVPSGDLRVQSSRLLSMYTCFDERNKRIFLSLLDEQIEFQRHFRALASVRNQAKASQDPQNRAKLCAAVANLTKYFPDPKRANDVLTKLIEIKNARIFKLLLELCRADIGYQDMEKAEAEFLKLVQRDIRSAQQKEFVQQFLAILKMQLLGRDQMTRLMGTIASARNPAFHFDDGGNSEPQEQRDQDTHQIEATLDFCVEVAVRLPSAFASCFPMMFGLVNSTGSDVPAQKICTLVRLTGWLFSGAPLSKIRTMVRQLGSFCESDENGLAAAAMGAIAALGQTPTDERHGANSDVTELVDEVIEELAASLTQGLGDDSKRAATQHRTKKQTGRANGNSNAAKERTAARLDALSIIAKSHPNIFQNHVEDIQSFVVSNVLAVGRNKSNRSPREMAQFPWKAKVAGIQLLTSSLLGLVDCEEAHAAAEPIWNLLIKVIETNGDISSQIANAMDDEGCGKIRLGAADCMLRILSKNEPNFERKFDLVKTIHALAIVAQDPLVSVRYGFTKVLFEALQGRKPSNVAYFGLLAIVGECVQDETTRELAAGRLRWLVQTRRSMIARSQLDGNKKAAYMPESSLCWLVHLLAHSPNIDAEYKNKYNNFIRIFEMFFAFGSEAKAVDSSYGSYMLNTLHYIQRAAVDATCEDRNGMIQSVAEAGRLVLQARLAGTHTETSNSTMLPRQLYKPAKSENTVSNLPVGFTVPKAKKFAKTSPEGETPFAGNRSSISPTGAPAKVTAKKRPNECKKRAQQDAFLDDSDEDGSDSASNRRRVGSRKLPARRARTLAPMLDEDGSEDEMYVD